MIPGVVESLLLVGQVGRIAKATQYADPKAQCQAVLSTPLALGYLQLLPSIACAVLSTAEWCRQEEQ